MPRLRVYLLGSPRVELDATLIVIRRRKSLALLAYLAITGQSHRRETLAALLWPDYDESRASAYLRQELWALRQKIGEELVEADAGQMSLVEQPEIWVDVLEFQEVLGEADKAETVPRELQALEMAAKLYQGDFLAGFTLSDAPAFDDWQFFQGDALRQDLARALERLVAAYISQGNYEEPIQYARRWVSLDPLHEPAHQALMRLYTWTGQYAAALRQYQECVRILDEELGVEPSKETADLYEAVKARRLPPPDVSETSPVVPVSSLETITDARLEEMPTEESPEEYEISHNLPPQSTLFIGREKELAALADLLDNPDIRLITLVGPGGMGKTRLALAAAERRLASRGGPQTRPYKDGVYFVPLAPISSVESLVPAITGSLKLNFPGTADPEAQLRNYLKSKQMLLVLDNFEHLLIPLGPEQGSGIDFIRDTLLNAPGVQALVTSRERLHLQQEQLYPIQGLEFPKTISEERSEMSGDAADRYETRYTAVQLFLQAAKRILPGIEITQDDQVYLARICQLVEGMPLGVELAAGWVDTLSLEDIAAEIQDNLDFLETDARDIPSRHRSMRAVFNASWRQMTPEEQESFPGLSAFRGGFTRQAAQAVAGASLRLLNKLVNKSLLSYNRDRDRYEIHELLRQYAQEKLETKPGTAEEVQATHARYFAGYARQLEGGLEGKNQWEAFAAIGIDLDNFHLAWEWGVEHADLVILEDCLDSLFWFSQRRGQVMTHARLFRKALDVFSIPGKEAPLHEELQAFLGRLQIKLGMNNSRLRYRFSKDLISDGIALLRQIGSGVEADIAYGLNILALEVYFKEGNYLKARKLAQEALKLATKVNKIKEIAYAYNVMGHLAEFQEEFREAGPLFEKSLRYYDQIGETIGRAYAVNNWGRAAYAIGDYDLARRLLEEALAVRRDFDDLIGQSYSLLDLGKLDKMQGNYEEAEVHMQASLDIAQDIGELDLVARCYNGLGMVAQATGKFTLSESLHKKSLETYQEIRVVRELPLTYNLLVKVTYAQGDFSLAKEWAEKALEASKVMENRGERASTLRYLGHISFVEGEWSTVWGYYQEALGILVETGTRPVMLDILVGWAQLLIQKNASEADRQQAVELLALAAHHPASEHETREQAKALLVEKFADLPAEDLEAAQTRRRALDLEVIVKTLLKWRG